MYLKNSYMSKKVNKIVEKKSKINPYTKSILEDYLTSDLILMSILGIALSVGVIVVVFTDIESFRQIGTSPPIFFGIIVILTFGFSSIIDSISNINWKFHAIICPQKFNYHIRKTLKVLLGCFCLLILTFCIIISLFGIFELVKYIYYLAVLMLFSVFNAFSLTNVIFKVIRLILFTVLAIWISTLHFGFLIILLIPLLFMGITVKDDYKERYLL
jgi:hypothetical protein